MRLHQRVRACGVITNYTWANFDLYMCHPINVLDLQNSHGTRFLKIQLPVFVDDGITNLRSLTASCTPQKEGLSAHELFTEDVVYKKLCLLNPAISPRPDAVHPHLLKSCADILAISLTCIFQLLHRQLFTG